MAPKKRQRTEKSRPPDALTNAVLDKVTCPITQSLVVRPAIAEDGFTYEREAVEGRAGTQKTSWRLCEMQVLSCAAWSGPVNILSEFWRNSSPRRGRGHSAETTRGDAAAATRIVRGDESRRGRGRDVDMEASHAGAAAATRTFR